MNKIDFVKKWSLMNTLAILSHEIPNHFCNIYFKMLLLCFIDHSRKKGIKLKEESIFSIIFDAASGTLALSDYLGRNK